MNLKFFLLNLTKFSLGCVAVVLGYVAVVAAVVLGYVVVVAIVSALTRFTLFIWEFVWNLTLF